MGSDRRRHSFHSYPDTPLRAVLEDLANASGQMLQKELTDLLLIMRYPYVLQRLNMPAAQVVMQTKESIRRLEQEIFAMKILLTEYTFSSNFAESEQNNILSDPSDSYTDAMDFSSHYIQDHF